MVAAGDAEMPKPAPDLVLFWVVFCCPPAVGMIFFFFTFFSFPSKDDLPMSCLSFMLTKLTEEETYGKTPFNEDHYVSPLPHTRL